MSIVLIGFIHLKTGKRAYFNEIKGGIEEDTGPFDDIEFLWKEFSSKGYKTSFGEDCPDWTLFNHLGKGFVKQPTDYYLRPFWLNAYKKETKSGASWNYCYYDKSIFRILMDQAKEFHMAGIKSHVPTFSFSFYIDLPHDNFNNLQLMDSDLSQFISEFPNMNSTIFILMGDHGNRFGSILETTIGKIEERMPFFGLFIPKNLISEYPSIKSILKQNEHSLVSWLDLHTTLMDIPSGELFCGTMS